MQIFETGAQKLYSAVSGFTIRKHFKVLFNSTLQFRNKLPVADELFMSLFIKSSLKMNIYLYRFCWCYSRMFVTTTLKIKQKWSEKRAVLGQGFSYIGNVPGRWSEKMGGLSSGKPFIRGSTKL